MKVFAAAAAFAVCGGLLAGCESTDAGPHEAAVDTVGTLGEPAANAEMVHMIFDRQSRNAVVTERTLYPYHFVPDGSELTALGVEQLDVLTAALQSQPADQPLYLNIRRGSTPDALYLSRVASVKQALASAGVEGDRVNLLDEVPRGKGIATEQLLNQESDSSRAPYQQRQPGGSGSTRGFGGSRGKGPGGSTKD
jgi:hypothetical protein